MKVASRIDGGVKSDLYNAQTPSVFSKLLSSMNIVNIKSCAKEIPNNPITAKPSSEMPIAGLDELFGKWEWADGNYLDEENKVNFQYITKFNYIVT